MEHFVWDMQPEIFRLGFIAPRYYGLMFALGFLTAYHIVQWMYQREGRNIEDLSSLLFHLIVGCVVGARLGHCLFYQPEYFLRNPHEILFIWNGGLASHGGSIGVILAAYLYSRKHPDQPFVWIMDRCAPGTAFVSGCIRVGNFFNSEIIGRPTDVSWAVIFKKIDMVPRHPAMLYESISYFTLAAILMAMYFRSGRDTKPGRLIGFMLFGIYLARIFIETVKENQVSFEDTMAFNMGQLLSIPFVIIGFLLMSGLYRKIIGEEAYDTLSVPKPAHYKEEKKQTPESKGPSQDKKKKKKRKKR